VPNPKDDKKASVLSPPTNVSPLPYELLNTTQPVQYQYPTQYQQVQHQSQPQQIQQQKQQEMRKIWRKVIIGTILLLFPIVNLIGIALLVDSLIHYLKLHKS
jgi:hypothetical protein